MAKKKASKTPQELIDRNGRWIEERGRIKGQIRRAFRLSPQLRITLSQARVELPPKTKKDGDPGKKNQVRYRCQSCGGLFPQAQVQVDHLDPVVPLDKQEADMTYDEIVRGVFCNLENLQVLCSTKASMLPKGQKSCHQLKSQEENFIRDRFQEKKFSLSYQEQLEIYRQQYKDYLIKQKQELEAKEERKRIREEKKRQK